MTKTNNDTLNSSDSMSTQDKAYRAANKDINRYSTNISVRTTQHHAQQGKISPRSLSLPNEEQATRNDALEFLDLYVTPLEKPNNAETSDIEIAQRNAKRFLQNVTGDDRLTSSNVDLYVNAHTDAAETIIHQSASREDLYNNNKKFRQEADDRYAKNISKSEKSARKTTANVENADEISQSYSFEKEELPSGNFFEKVGTSVKNFISDAFSRNTKNSALQSEEAARAHEISDSYTFVDKKDAPSQKKPTGTQEQMKSQAFKDIIQNSVQRSVNEKIYRTSDESTPLTSEESERKHATEFYNKYVDSFITEGANTKDETAISHAKRFLRRTAGNESLDSENLDKYINSHVEAVDSIISRSHKRDEISQAKKSSSQESGYADLIQKQKEQRTKSM